MMIMMIKTMMMIMTDNYDYDYNDDGDDDDDEIYPTLPYDLKEGHRMMQREIFGHLPKAVRPTLLCGIIMTMIMIINHYDHQSLPSS